MIENKSKVLRKIIAGSLAVLMLTTGYSVLPVSAGFPGASMTVNAAPSTISLNGFSYEVISSYEKTLKLINYSNTESDVQPEVLNIPGNVEMNGNVYTVTEIGNVSGDINQIRKVTLPSTITAIRSSAFTNFSGIESIEIQEGVKTLEDNVFFGCTNLAVITMNADSIEEVGCNVINNTAFYENHADGNILIGKVYFGFKGEPAENTQMVIPEGTKVVAGGLYATKNITSVSFPSSLKTIGARAFDSTGIKDLVFPASVNKLYINGSSAFTSEGSYETVDMSQCAIEEILSPYSGVFYNCSSLKTLKLPKNLNYLPVSLCNNCSALTTVVMPDNIERFSGCAFRSCRNIETLRIPDSTKKIEGSLLGVLENSYSDKYDNLRNFSSRGTLITSSKLNNKIVSGDCTLSNAFIDNNYIFNAQSFGFSMFMEKSENDSDSTITKNAFADTYFGSRIKLFIEEGVSIAEGASVSCWGTFIKDTTEKTLTIKLNNDYVPVNEPSRSPFKDGQKINYNGEEYTVRLENVSLYNYTVLDDDTLQITGYLGSEEDVMVPDEIDGKDVTEIGDGNGSIIYSEIKKLILPDSVRRINDHAFDQSTLKEIVLPKSLTEIGRYAFKETQLESLTIPSSVSTFADLYSIDNSENAEFRNLCIYDNSAFEKMKVLDQENNEIELSFFMQIPERVLILKSQENVELSGKPFKDEFNNIYYVQDTVNVSQDFKDSNPNYCIVNINNNTKTVTVGSEIKRTSTELKVPDSSNEIFIENNSYTLVHNIRLVNATESNCLVPGVKEHYEDEEGGCYKLENGVYVPMNEQEIQELYLELDPDKHVFGENGECTVCHKAYNNGVGIISGNSLNLDSTIGINFYMNFNEGFAEANPDAYMEFTYENGKTEQVKVIDAEVVQSDEIGNDTSVKYCFQCHVAAKEMNDNVTAKFYKKDGTEVEGISQVYSVRKYADYVMKHIEEFETDFNLITLIDAMMTYGKYAQSYFKYGDMINLYSYPQEYLEYIASLQSEESEVLTCEKQLSNVDADSLNSDQEITNSEDNSIVFVGSNLSLKSETVLRLFFDVKTEDELEVEVDESTDYEILDNGKYKYIEIKDSAVDVSKEHQIRIYSKTDSTIQASGSYSALKYAYLVLSREESATRTPELKKLLRALYLYSQSAGLYFNPYIDIEPGTDDGPELG